MSCHSCPACKSRSENRPTNYCYNCGGEYHDDNTFTPRTKPPNADVLNYKLNYTKKDVKPVRMRLKRNPNEFAFVSKPSVEDTEIPITIKRDPVFMVMGHTLPNRRVHQMDYVLKVSPALEFPRDDLARAIVECVDTNIKDAQTMQITKAMIRARIIAATKNTRIPQSREAIFKKPIYPFSLGLSINVGTEESRLGDAYVVLDKHGMEMVILNYTALQAALTYMVQVLKETGLSTFVTINCVMTEALAKPGAVIAQVPFDGADWKDVQ